MDCSRSFGVSGFLKKLEILCNAISELWTALQVGDFAALSVYAQCLQSFSGLGNSLNLIQWHPTQNFRSGVRFGQGQTGVEAIITFPQSANSPLALIENRLKLPAKLAFVINIDIAFACNAVHAITVSQKRSQRKL